VRQWTTHPFCTVWHIAHRYPVTTHTTRIQFCPSYLRPNPDLMLLTPWTANPAPHGLTLNPPKGISHIHNLSTPYDTYTIPSILSTSKSGSNVVDPVGGCEENECCSGQHTSYAPNAISHIDNLSTNTTRIQFRPSYYLPNPDLMLLTP